MTDSTPPSEEVLDQAKSDLNDMKDARRTHFKDNDDAEKFRELNQQVADARAARRSADPNRGVIGGDATPEG